MSADRQAKDWSSASADNRQIDSLQELWFPFMQGQRAQLNCPKPLCAQLGVLLVSPGKTETVLGGH